MLKPRLLALVGVAAVALGGPALADSRPGTWDGVYVGAHGGYAWGDNTGYLNDPTLSTATNSYSPSGGLFGFQFGYNRQVASNWVLGYEVDISFGGISETPITAVGGIVGPGKYEIDNFGTARTRLGYVQGPWMFFGSAGLAWATTSFSFPAGATAFNNRPQVGYAVGLGLEYAINRNWSAKVEYLYADLGETNVVVDPLHNSHDLSLSMLRLGVNYRFDGSGEATSPRAYASRDGRGKWQGAYIGVHGGYGWASQDVDVSALGARSLDGAGAFGGFQSGYNWQLGPGMIVGLEADTSFGSLKETAAGSSVEVDTMGTVRARLGVIAGGALLYGTGGLAWAHSDTFHAPSLTTFDVFRLGWTAGAGAEYALSRDWSAKVEYLYADFGTQREFHNGNTPVSDLSTHTVRVGVNYRSSLFEMLGIR